MKPPIIVLFLLCYLQMLSNLQATVYYVRAGGNDAHAGTSVARAWASVSRVNEQVFSPGDSVLFEAGATFQGSITLQVSGGGDGLKPVLISSYGKGRAVIMSGSAHGIMLYNLQGIRISKLNLTGGGREQNNAAGIDVYMDLPEARLKNISIDSVEVQGYKKSGIQVGSWKGASGYDDVSITHCLVHDNGNAGISTYAEARLGHKNFYVAFNKAYNNSGLPELTTHHSGSGIVLGGVDGALIEYCEAYNNGWLNAWKGGGPVGIWGYHCNNLLIQFNESHHNKSGTAKDGGGFDIDGGCTSCTIQYNYSHDNHGPGYLIAQYPNAPEMKGVVVRYNISENDARTGNYGAIHLWSSGASGGIQDAEVYHNTVYLTPSATGSPKAIYVHSGGLKRSSIRNNILQTTAGLPLVYLDKLTEVRFEGNHYWGSGEKMRIHWAGKMFEGLADWQTATGQEMLQGKAVGVFGDPGLKNPGKSITVGDPAYLFTLSAYQLLLAPVQAAAAIDMHAFFGTDTGPMDFWGNTLANREVLYAGAHQPTANSKGCLYGGIVSLPSMEPAGGFFEGKGVVEGNMFDPLQTGAGLHQLWYVYSNALGKEKRLPFTIRVTTAAKTRWIGIDNGSTDWFDSQNWTACVPTALIDAEVAVPQLVQATAAAGVVPELAEGKVAQVKSLMAPDTLSFAGDGTLEIWNGYSGKGLKFGKESTLVLPLKKGQQIPAGIYGKLVLEGKDHSLAGQVRVEQLLKIGQGKLYLNGNRLVIGSEASIMGANEESYLVMDKDASVTRLGVAGSAWFDFPVGTAASYSPASIQNTGIKDDFRLSLQEGVYSLGDAGERYPNAHVNLTWHLDEKVPGGSLVGLRLQWHAADQLPDFLWSESYISHYENNKWSLPDAHAGHALESAPGIYQLSLQHITSFSPFAIRDRSFVLPVVFHDLEVYQADDAVIVRWQTASEKANAGFFVEVSENGVDYRTLGFVASSSADSYSLKTYTFKDVEPDKQGMRYYRLRQQDLNGDISYSLVKAVQLEEALLQLRAFPNPFADSIELLMDARAAGHIDVSIKDIQGRTIHAAQYALAVGEEKLYIKLPDDVKAGVYLLTAVFAGKVYQLQLVKQ